jgi:hypothetical protein
MEQRSQGSSNESGTHDDDYGASLRSFEREALHELHELRERVGELNQQVVEFIKNRPGTALLIAAGAGFLIGRMLRS